MRGISFPFRFAGGKTVTSVAEGRKIDKIKESLEQIVLTAKREWLDDSVGTVTSDLLFKGDSNMVGYYADQIKADILAQETRIADLSVFVAFDRVKALMNLVITYKVDGSAITQLVEI